MKQYVVDLSDCINHSEGDENKRTIRLFDKIFNEY